MIAYAKLAMLMADLGEECNVDWNDYSQIKYCIFKYKNELTKKLLVSSNNFLAFKTKKIRDAFFDKHEQLIKEYEML